MSEPTPSRTHTARDLSQATPGEPVTLCGHMHARPYERDPDFDVIDGWGVVRVSLAPGALDALRLARQLRPGDAVVVVGTLRGEVRYVPGMSEIRAQRILTFSEPAGRPEGDGPSDDPSDDGDQTPSPRADLPPQLAPLTQLLDLRGWRAAPPPASDADLAAWWLTALRRRLAPGVEGVYTYDSKSGALLGALAWAGVAQGRALIDELLLKAMPEGPHDGAALAPTLPYNSSLGALGLSSLRPEAPLPLVDLAPLCAQQGARWFGLVTDTGPAAGAALAVRVPAALSACLDTWRLPNSALQRHGVAAGWLAVGSGKVEGPAASSLGQAAQTTLLELTGAEPGDRLLIVLGHRRANALEWADRLRVGLLEALDLQGCAAAWLVDWPVLAYDPDTDRLAHVLRAEVALEPAQAEARRALLRASPTGPPSALDSPDAAAWCGLTGQTAARVQGHRLVAQIAALQQGETPGWPRSMGAPPPARPPCIAWALRLPEGRGVELPPDPPAAAQGSIPLVAPRATLFYDTRDPDGELASWRPVSPLAAIGAHEPALSAGSVYVFEDKSESVSPICSRRWTCEELGFESGAQAITLRLPEAGWFTLCLEIEDSLGNSDIAAIQLAVSEPE